MVKGLLLSLAEAGELVNEVGLVARHRHARGEVLEKFELPTIVPAAVTVLKLVLQVAQIATHGQFLLDSFALLLRFFLRFGFPLLFFALVLERLCRLLLKRLHCGAVEHFWELKVDSRHASEFLPDLHHSFGRETWAKDQLSIVVVSTRTLLSILVNYMAADDLFDIVSILLILCVKVGVDEVHGHVPDRPGRLLLVSARCLLEVVRDHRELVVEAVVRRQEPLYIAFLKGDKVRSLAHERAHDGPWQQRIVNFDTSEWVYLLRRKSVVLEEGVWRRWRSCLPLGRQRFVRGDDALIALKDFTVEHDAHPARQIALHEVPVVLLHLG